MSILKKKKKHDLYFTREFSFISFQFRFYKTDFYNKINFEDHLH